MTKSPPRLQRKRRRGSALSRPPRLQRSRRGARAATFQKTSLLLQLELWVNFACHLGGLIHPKISPPDHVSLLLAKSCLSLILYSHTRIWGLGLDLIGQTTQKIKGFHKTYCFHSQLLWFSGDAPRIRRCWASVWIFPQGSPGGTHP